jgi:transcriptional regulator with XRE-family HTH domain
MAVYSKSNRFIVDGAELSRVRVAADMSMDRMAKKLGCNRAQVSRWEQGVLTPSEGRILIMTQILGTQSFVRENPQFKGER